MIKILIIDDEPLVRMGMKTIIEWQKYGYSIVGEGGNGLQGLERIRSLNPDIVLIDLMMPQMNGIEVIRRAREEGFRGKFIILTCVSEFEYLQQAIRLGVSSYILKSSVSPEEILKTVNEITGEIEKSRIFMEDVSGNYVEENFVLNEFLNLVFKKVILVPEDIKEKLRAFGYTGEQDLYLQVYSVQKQGGMNTKVLYKMSAIGKSIIDESGWGSGFVNYEDYLVMLFSCSSEKAAEAISFRMKESARQYFDLELTGETEKIDTDLFDIGKKYDEIKGRLAMAFFGEHPGGSAEDWIPATEYSSYQKLAASLEIIRGMVVQSRILTEKEVKKVYISVVKYVMELFELKDSQILRELPEQTDAAGSTVTQRIGEVRSVERIHDLTLEILKKCYDLAERKGYVGSEDELTDKMIRYIYENCNGKISTRDVAEHVHFSVDYTCKYFKKKTGTNLTDYILKLKISRSKKELMEGKSLAEVAEQYGFSSDGHYARVFKKYEGMTPGSYVRESREQEHPDFKRQKKEKPEMAEF